MLSTITGAATVITDAQTISTGIGVGNGIGIGGGDVDCIIIIIHVCLGIGVCVGLRHHWGVRVVVGYGYICSG